MKIVFQAPTERFELKSVNGLYILIILCTRFIVNPWSAHLQSNASHRQVLTTQFNHFGQFGLMVKCSFIN